MPGIGGFVDSHGSSSKISLAEMIKSMCHYSWHRVEDKFLTQKNVGLGRVSLGILNQQPQPFTDVQTSSCIVFDGELYASADAKSGLSDSLSDNPGDAELVLRGYLAEGTEFFKQLQGKFVAAIWDARSQQLVLANDCFGMKPLYYCHSQGWFGFASEIKALLQTGKVSTKHDPKGIAQFFGFGHYWNNETMYQSIRAFSAGSVLTYRPETDELEGFKYHQFNSQCDKTTSKQELLDSVGDAFKTAVDLRANGTRNLGLSLSGGLDARTILGVMDRDSTEVTSICLGIEGSLDHRSSSQLAALAGSAYHPYTLNDKFLTQFEQHLREMVLLTDGHYLSQCIVMPTLPFYRELGVEVLLRGHGGELMHLRKAYNFSIDREGREITNETGLKTWLMKRLRAYMLEQVDTQLFAEITTEELDILATESLDEGLQETADWSDQVQRMSHLFVNQRLRRETSMSLVKIGSFVETRLPYIDQNVVQSLFNLPIDLKLGEELQGNLLQKHFPEFLNVTNVNTGARIGASALTRQLSYYRMRVLAKLGVKGYQPYERLGLWLRRELEPVVKKILLSEQCLERGLFRPDSVRRVISQHSKNECNHTFLLMAMMICELGQQMFIDQKSSGVS